MLRTFIAFFAFAAVTAQAQNNKVNCTLQLTTCMSPYSEHFAMNDAIRKEMQSCRDQYRDCKALQKTGAFTTGEMDPLALRVLEKCLDPKLNNYASQVCLEVGQSVMKSCDPAVEKSKTKSAPAKNQGFDT